jgi:hypothetical protein
LGYFFHKKVCINFGKNGLSDIWGHFFTNSSGHPAANQGLPFESGHQEQMKIALINLAEISIVISNRKSRGKIITF